jgi:hypothetical protein
VQKEKNIEKHQDAQWLEMWYAAVNEIKTRKKEDVRRYLQ